MTLTPKGILDERKGPPLAELGNLMCMQPVIFSNQTYLLAGYESGIFLTWDLRTASVINVAQFEECPIAFDFCSEANRGIYGNTTDKLGIFGYQRNEMKLINRGDICIKNPGTNCVRIRKDQKVFCTGGNDGRVRVFSWKSLRPLAVLTEHKTTLNDIVYSPGKVDLWKSPIMACAGNDGQISLWNLYNNWIYRDNRHSTWLVDCGLLNAAPTENIYNLRFRQLKQRSVGDTISVLFSVFFFHKQNVQWRWITVIHTLKYVKHFKWIYWQRDEENWLLYSKQKNIWLIESCIYFIYFILCTNYRLSWRNVYCFCRFINQLRHSAILLLNKTVVCWND